MKATTKDLRLHTAELLAAVDRGEKVTITYRGVRRALLTRCPEQEGPKGVAESEMIIAGDVDALVTAIEPRAYADGHPKVRLLFPNVRATEKEYFKRTGVFPKMHAVAIRKDFAEAHPTLKSTCALRRPGVVTRATPSSLDGA